MCLVEFVVTTTSEL